VSHFCHSCHFFSGETDSQFALGIYTEVVGQNTGSRMRFRQPGMQYENWNKDVGDPDRNGIADRDHHVGRAGTGAAGGGLLGL
jgi:hypothetical protein